MTDSHSDILISAISELDRPWIQEFHQTYWGSSIIITQGEIHQVDGLPGFIARLKGEIIGIITYQIRQHDCEIISLNSFLENHGVGTSLISRVKEISKSQGCGTLTVITTNDNIAAQEFYFKRGFKLRQINKDVMKEYRKLKPEIPETGIDGIQIKDEIVFYKDLR